MNETTKVIKEYLFAFQNNLYSLTLEKAFVFFKYFLFNISEINHDKVINKLSLDEYNKDTFKFYSEIYSKRYLINLYDIYTNDFRLILIIYFLYYLNQYENSIFKNKFVDELLNKKRLEFFEELFNLLNYIDKNIDYQNNISKIYFTNEFKSRTIYTITENIKSFLNKNTINELNNVFLIFVERLDLFNNLFKKRMYSVNEIIDVLTQFQKEEWAYALDSMLIYPNNDYDINIEEMKWFIKLYWVYYTLNNFRKHLKIFTTDYFYYKKKNNNKISKAEEIAQSHYLLYLRQFVDNGNNEHKIIDHEKHFGGLRYDILINEFEGFPPFIIECKFTINKITDDELKKWVNQIHGYIQKYNESYDSVQINNGLLLVFHNNKAKLQELNILENINDNFYKIKYVEPELYLFSVNID
uniref:Uncharacterized protein n=1 Tax=Marinitoga okinawensis TaxID=389480 RepID=A0A9C7GWZ3_9BACT|nr:hypothetical protein [Marinitoga okinawensis]CAI4093958.1 Hypothetical protein PMO1_06 [Marinitoga okinawensis]